MLWWISDSVQLYVLVAGKRGIPIKFVCWECNISTFYHSDTETQDASASHNHPANIHLQMLKSGLCKFDAGWGGIMIDI